MDTYSMGHVLERCFRPLSKDIDAVLVYILYILVFSKYPFLSAV